MDTIWRQEKVSFLSMTFTLSDDSPVFIFSAAFFYLLSPFAYLLSLRLLFVSVILPIPDHGPFREVTFNFVSDASISRRGFYIEFTQELCSTSLKEGISYSVVNSPVSPSSSSSSSSFQSSSSSSSAIHPPISVISLNSPSNKGSPEYPSNYVARAQLEQIVEAQVTVLDSKDGLSVPAIQVSSVVSNDAISSNHSYPSLG